jgi:hypothetical protein
MTFSGLRRVAHVFTGTPQPRSEEARARGPAAWRESGMARARRWGSPQIALAHLVLAMLALALLLLRDPVAADWHFNIVYLLPGLVAALWFGGPVGAAWAVLGAVMVEGEASISLARCTGFAVIAYLVGRITEQRRALRAEVAELQALQRVLTPPPLFSRPPLDIAATYRPAADGVAGDFYLVTDGRDGLVVCVGDAIGMGREAALAANFVRSSILADARFTDDPARLLELANAALVAGQREGEMFVTAVCVSIYGDASLRWASAGHPAPLRLDGAIFEGLRPSCPLGVSANFFYESGEGRLEPGGGFVLFTDGLSEARRNGHQFGSDGIERALWRVADGSSQDIVDELRATAEQFSDGELADDLCVLALRCQAA